MPDDNYICPAPSNTPELDAQILREYEKAPGWLPFDIFDMVQSGYPRPDHGEMIKRAFGGTDKHRRLLPPSGMWVKAEDIKGFITSIAPVAQALRDMLTALEEQEMARRDANGDWYWTASGEFIVNDATITILQSARALLKGTK